MGVEILKAPEENQKAADFASLLAFDALAYQDSSEKKEEESVDSLQEKKPESETSEELRRRISKRAFAQQKTEKPNTVA